MEKTEKPKSWQERRKDIKHKWLTPLIYIEWLCELLSYRLGRWAFLDILGHMGRFSVLASVVVGVGVYWWEAPKRKEQAENQRKAKHYQAWQVINDAQGKPSSSGRIYALQDLNKDKVPLAGVDISKAFLVHVDLQNAILWEANFSMARLDYATLSGADLWDANLSGVDLVEANLSGAHIKYANLSEVDFRGANLSGADLYKVENWREIRNINLTNIYGIKNPPDGFIKWAKNKGAVELGEGDPNYSDWLTKRKQKQ